MYNRSDKILAAAKNVFIGMNRFILKGVIIGQGSVIGACSAGTRDVSLGVIIAGNPAQVVRAL